MKKSLLTILEQQGLSSRESRVYLTLLASDDGTPSLIARKSNVARPTTYLALEKLVQMGLATHVRRSKGVTYRALSPHLLLEQSHDRHEQLKSVMETLHSIRGVADPRPQMSIFEGPDGLLQMMEDTLTSDGPILYWADMTLVTTTVFRDYWPIYIKKRVAKRVHTKGIISADRLGLAFKERGKAELREAVLIPKERFPFKNEINIYNDKLAIISHRDLVGVIIQNRNIADTQRSIFNFAYDCAKLLETRTIAGLRARE